MAYENTNVPVQRSFGDLAGLVVGRGGQLQQTEAQNGFQVAVAFPSKKAPQSWNKFRITVELPEDFGESWLEEHPKVRKTADEVIAQERRRLARVLFYYVKNAMEAVDAGLLELEEVLLPFLEVANGQTLYDTVKVHVDKGQVGAKAGLMALGSGAKGGDGA